MKTSVAHYLGTGAANHPHASPLYGNLVGLPPIQMHVGTSEVLLDDTLSFAAKVSATGDEATAHVWQGMPHVFPSSFGILDAGEQAMSTMAVFIRAKVQPWRPPTT